MQKCIRFVPLTVHVWSSNYLCYNLLVTLIYIMTRGVIEKVARAGHFYTLMNVDVVTPATDVNRVQSNTDQGMTGPDICGCCFFKPWLPFFAVDFSPLNFLLPC